MVPKRHDRRRTDEKIDVSDLTEILDIDTSTMTCTAESGATFTDIVRATLPHGLVPYVVPELRTITIGGAVAGCSLESMSFQHGGFHDTCLEYELITARGEVLSCTPDNEHRLIFQMLHSSFGTLGVLSKLKFRLVPAQPFVRLEHHTHTTLESYQREIQQHVDRGDVDFMDGIIHSPTQYVLCVGWFTDRAPYTNRYDWMKVYYRSTATRTEDYLRTEDYFYRYDNGVTNPNPRTAIGRLLFGKFFHSTELLTLAERFPWLIPAKNPQMTLDLFIPFSKFQQFIDWYRTELDYFPMWCVPYKIHHKYEWLSETYASHISERELYVDLAIYGADQRTNRNEYKILEDGLARVEGIKTLIAYNYYEEDEFWKIWNRPNYRAAKSVTDPDNIFRDLWEKTCRASQGR